MSTALVQGDAGTFGLLLGVIGLVYMTSHSRHPVWKILYSVIPALMLVYFIPGILTMTGVISSKGSNLYYVASRFFLPASLILLTMALDIKAILSLGPKAVIMFFAGTFGVVIGGPLTIILISLFNPDFVGGHGPDAIWRGMTSIAGSWIGGSANQTAMKEVWHIGDQIYSAMITVDAFVALTWMGILIAGAERTKKLDRWLKADTSTIDTLKVKITKYRKKIERMPKLIDLVQLMSLTFVVVGFSHIVANFIASTIQDSVPILKHYGLASSFLWLIILTTTIGIGLSFTKAKRFEGVGASRYATLFIYILIASIGMNMDISAIINQPEIILVGLIWMLIHVLIMFVVAKIIRAPFFFVAVGSMANIGGAASAPVVASVFSTSLAPVGALLGILGYAVGTYGALICGYLMRSVVP